MPDVLSHRPIRLPWLSLADAFHQIAVEPTRQSRPARRHIIKPIKCQNMIPLDRFAQRLATGALRDPKVKLHMQLMDRKQEFAIVFATGKTAVEQRILSAISRRSCALARSGRCTATGCDSTRATVSAAGFGSIRAAAAPRIGQLLTEPRP
jgi:hypothetical protein